MEIVEMFDKAVELEHSSLRATGFASASEKSSKLSSVIPRSLLRGVSLRLLSQLNWISRFICR